MREATETIQAVVPECGSHVVSVVPHDHEDILIFKGPVAEKRLHLLRNKFRGMLRVERRNVQSEILPFEIDEKMYGQADVGVIGPTRPDVCRKRKDSSRGSCGDNCSLHFGTYFRRHGRNDGNSKRLLTWDFVSRKQNVYVVTNKS